MTKEEKIEKAVQCYLRRKDRTENPAGKFDKQGRFYPSLEEYQDCCTSIRTPSKNWPYSLMVHCRTAEHISNLHAVDVHELRRKIYAANKMRREVIKVSAALTA